MSRPASPVTEMGRGQRSRPHSARPANIAPARGTMARQEGAELFPAARAKAAAHPPSRGISPPVAQGVVGQEPTSYCYTDYEDESEEEEQGTDEDVEATGRVHCHDDPDLFSVALEIGMKTKPRDVIMGKDHLEGRQAESWIKHTYKGNGSQAIQALKLHAGQNVDKYYAACVGFRGHMVKSGRCGPQVHTVSSEWHMATAPDGSCFLYNDKGDTKIVDQEAPKRTD